MNSEHNPIAHLVTKIQHHWIREISGDPRPGFICWQIQSDERPVYEGFLKLESSALGSVPDKMITLITPFSTVNTFSSELVKTWNAALSAENIPSILEYEKNIAAAPTAANNYMGSTSDVELLSSLGAFQQQHLKTGVLVICIFPISVSESNELCKWMEAMLGCGVPANIRFVLFHFEDVSFKIFVRKHQPAVKLVSINLNLDEAMQCLLSGGDPASAAVQMRKSLFSMSNAVETGNLVLLNQAADISFNKLKNQGNMGLLAMSKLFHAGMLFNFRNYNAVIQALEQGLPYLERGLDQGDITSTAMAVQYYGYLAAASRLAKNNQEAIRWYTLQATTAQKTNNTLQAVSGWFQASEIARSNNCQQQKNLLISAFNAGANTEPSSLFYSEYCFVGLTLYRISQTEKDESYCVIINNKMTSVYGNNWIETTETRKKLWKLKQPEMHSPAVN